MTMCTGPYINEVILLPGSQDKSDLSRREWAEGMSMVLEFNVICMCNNYIWRRGKREGAPIHTPMIKFSDCWKYRIAQSMPSDNFIIVKKSGSQAGIEPTTFGELAENI